MHLSPAKTMMNFSICYLFFWCTLLFESVFLVTGGIGNETYRGRRYSKDPGICGNLDIRNSVVNLEIMRGCRVVEGFVQILLFDHANETDFEAYSFPELKEITSYLLLYRVSGIKSLSRLFPNLSVIRGNELFFDYALVIYENYHIQEIGLNSLTAILRGGVRIEKNPSLCYVNTIDWLAMHSAADSSGEWDNFIAENEESTACPGKCPGCNPPHCWTAQSCQRICTEKCGLGVACDVGSDGEIFCCHEECIGGCTGKKVSDCVACRHATYEGNCVPSCPDGYYRYLGRRCVSEDECINMNFNHHPLGKEPGDGMDGFPDSMPPMDEGYQTTKSRGLIPIAGECVSECPTGMEEDTEGKGCVPCRNGTCRKRCQGEKIDNIETAQYYRGCTDIDGSLEIEFKRGGKTVMDELEKALGKVEVISGYLKVARSLSLISLDFLRNLREIQGKTLESGRSVIVVDDNQNLRRLWDWNARLENLTIPNGRLFFNSNPHLCLSEIEKLRNLAHLGEHTNVEVNSASNGYRGDCYGTEMNAYVVLRSPYKVSLRWQRFSLPKKLLGYTVHYIEASEEEADPEVSYPCGKTWYVEDVIDDENGKIDGNMQEHNLTNLSPFTKYAYYVKVEASVGGYGGRSLVQYFRTPPSRPTMPLGLTVKPLSESSILLKWDPPISVNGNLSHYQLIGRWQKEDEKFLEQRDFCVQTANVASITRRLRRHTIKDDTETTEMPGIFMNKKPAPELNEEWKSDCCANKKAKLDCQVYRYNYVGFESTKEKYGLHACDGAMYTLLQSNEFYGEDDSLNNEVIQTEQNYEKYDGQTVIYFEKQVNNVSYEAHTLKNYGLYFFQVRACRKPYFGEGHDNSSSCSPAATIIQRTKPLPSADTVRSVRVFFENGSYIASWREPVNPNGAILTYNIEYQRRDILNVQPLEECITNKQFHLNNRMIKLQGLPDGEYSIRVRIKSLSDYGPFSEAIKFTISTVTSNSLDAGILWGSVVGVVLMIVVFAIFLYILCYKQGRGGSTELRLIASVNPEYFETLPKETYVVDAWEVQRNKVKLIREIGQGSFGMVYEGIMEKTNGKQLPCAVKTINEGASVRERIEFLNEATVMKTFSTHHVVKLLGVVSKGSPTLVIMELMAIGDLKTYLRKQREDSNQEPSLSRIIRMAAEVADGMAYLTSRKFVHRDLAARNCMVAADLTVKVGDFGMARDIYETDYYRKGTRGLLPVRWMAPESLRDGVFTSQSDVWSYGIVVWEMATLASQPYQGLSNQEVLQFVIEGGVMSYPDQSPLLLTNIMGACWKHNPSERPSFCNIIAFLEPELEEDFKKVSFVHSVDSVVQRPIQNGEVNLVKVGNIHGENERNASSPIKEDEETFQEL